MFEFFFKYPLASFLKGHFVLLGRWPGWVLVLLILATAGGLAWLIWIKRAAAVPKLQGWRGWLIWGLEAVMVALVLLLLWEPAMTVAELSSQQNIIAVLVDARGGSGEGHAGRGAGGVAEAVSDAGLPAG